MGIWAGIKHALNSTLGTKDFQPLDKMLYLGKSTISSTNPLFLISNGGEFNYNDIGNDDEYSTGVIGKTLVAKSKGSFSISFKLTYSQDLGTGGIGVFINGEFVTSRSGSEVSNATLRTNSVSYSEGDVITIKIRRGYNSRLDGSKTFEISNIELCADVVDVSMFKIV